MTKKEIENLRKKINTMIVSKDRNSEELLKASQEMDIIIVEYQKKQMELWRAEKLKKLKLEWILFPKLLWAAGLAAKFPKRITVDI